MNSFDTIWNEMKPTFEFLSSAVALMNRLENTNFIDRMVKRLLNKKKNKRCNASSGYSSTSASSGYSSKSASSGYSSTSASSGDYSTSASSGNYSTSASSGNYSTSASSGNYSTSASSGYSSKSASSGNSSKSASSGDYSTSASSGYSSTSASSGDYSTSASSGNYSTSASSGYSSKAECQGWGSACAAVGIRAAVRGGLGNLLMCSEYKKDKDDKYIPVGGFAKIVDGKNIKPDCWYICENKKPVEVDFTDNVFSRVISTKTIKGNTIKEIIIDGESKKSYLVISGDKAAHGETIAKAKADLRYKISNRDTSKYKDWKLTDTHTAEEIIEAYRVITGACFYGTKSFCDSIKLPKKATIEEAIKITSGQYGSDKFKEFFIKG